MKNNNKNIIIKGKNNSLIIAAGSTIKNIDIVICGNNNKLILGKGVYADTTFSMISHNSHITVGDGCTIFKSFISAYDGKDITIGKDCLFADPTDIRTSDYHPIFDSNNKHINPSKSIVIGDRVWLARQVNILKGSHIESDVVIGVGSVVSGHIPANSVAVGVPAHVIRSETTWRLT
ncbi:MAG: hypothetical protein Q9M50_13180 [Methylococcales bacterium]|nr:hypothetical protein [Methylococcales bacterium]